MSAQDTKNGIFSGIAVASAIVSNARNNGVPVEVVADVLVRLMLDPRAVEIIFKNTETSLEAPELETAKLEEMLNLLMVLATESLEASVRAVNAKVMS